MPVIMMIIVENSGCEKIVSLFPNDKSKLLHRKQNRKQAGSENEIIKYPTAEYIDWSLSEPHGGPNE